MSVEPVALGPHDEIADKPFVSVGLIASDRIVLTSILGDVIRIVGDSEAGEIELTPYHQLAWRERGKTRRTMICNEERLRSHPNPCVVGFFGERDPSLDASPLEVANTAIVGAFADHPGVLSYSSIELETGRWANLVLHEDPSDKERWRQNPLHAEAVSVLSPVHYENVRIHNGVLSASLADSPEIVITATKYFDYSGPQLWRAVRSLV